MADGYQLDYKKVHNTLGEPNENKYGEEIGQYITDLWPQKDSATSTNRYQIEGILIENSDNYRCSNNYLYGTSYLPYSSLWWPVGTYEAQVYLIDFKKTVNGSYNVTTVRSNTSITIPKTEIGAGSGNIHFKVTAVKNTLGIWVPFDAWGFFKQYMTNQWFVTSYKTQPVPLTENTLYTITNENKERIYYYIFGYDEDRQEYVLVNDSIYHSYWEEQNIIFRCPDVGLVDSNYTPTISGIYPKVDQWYIIFGKNDSLPFSYNHLFFSSSIPLVVSQTGQIIKNTYSENLPIKTFTKHTTNIYSDVQAINILNSHPPILTFNDDGSPDELSIDEDLATDSLFINWLQYKNYNLVLVTIRDHTGTHAKTTHQYEHLDDNFTVEDKRYGILRYISYNQVALPTYEWTPSTLDNTITFDTLDNDKSIINARRLDIRYRRYVYTCSVEQIPNQCQMCGWDSIDDEENYKTHICFALATIRKNSRHISNNIITDGDSHYIFNGSHITMADVPVAVEYYSSTSCTLTSYKN